MLQIFVATTGLAVGSFLGAVIERQNGLPGRYKRKTSGRFNRSFCFQCGHQLRWWENIPIFSFVFLGGKCRMCHSPIPRWLPMIELSGAMGGVVIGGYLNNLGYVGALGWILVAAALIWIFFSDLVYGMVPDSAVAIGIAGAGLSHIRTIGYAVAAGVGTAAFFWVLVVATRGRGMGLGDVTLAFFLGVLLGWPLIIVGMWLAFVSGALVGLALIATGRKRFGQTIPFGPFMILGSILALKWGNVLLGMLF